MVKDALDRWRRPADWRRPGRVALANVRAVDPSEPAHAALLAAGVEVLAAPLRDEAGGVGDVIAGSDVVVSGGAPLDAAFFAALETTRLLLRPYVGYDDVDVAAATAAGVLVANVPDAIAADVANQTMAMILAANREVPRLDAFVRGGEWARTGRRLPEGMALHRPSAQTLGLVGFGGIARETAARARPFGYRVVAHDPYAPASAFAEHGVAPLPLDDLLRQADVVSIHVLLSPETHHLIDADRLALMKPAAWIVNTARGRVIDEEALVAALREGRVGGAALDVMAEIALQVALGGLPQRHVVVDRDLYDRLVALPELAGVPRS